MNKTLHTALIGSRVAMADHLEHCWKLPSDGEATIVAVWIDKEDNIKVALKGVVTGQVQEGWLSHFRLL